MYLIPLALVFIFYNLCVLFLMRWVFVAMSGLSLVVESGGYSLVRVSGASHCGGFCCGAQALGTWGSVAAACWLYCVWASVAVAHELSCSTAWNLHRPGIKPVSFALAGKFLFTVPPGKSSVY